MASVFLPHLHTGWHVDQAILSEEDRIVVVRFGRTQDIECEELDEKLFGIAERVRRFAAIYVCDIDEVPDLNEMYELYDNACLMFFYRNKHIMVDFGTGNNNKLNFPIENTQDLIDIFETVFRGARKGKGLVVSPIDFSRVGNRDN